MRYCSDSYWDWRFRSRSILPNDAVVRGTCLIGNFLPVSIFGVVVVGLLLNAAVGLISRRMMLKGTEFAVAAAVARVACGYPSSGFYRGASQITAMPAHWLQTNSSWKNVDIASYVPGGDPLVAQGHLADPAALVAYVLDPPGPGFTAVAEQLPAADRDRLGALAAKAEAGPPDFSDLRLLKESINRAIVDRGWLQAAIADGAGNISSEARELLKRSEALITQAAEAAEAGEGQRATFWTSEADQTDARARRQQLAAESDGALREAPAGEGVLLGGMRRALCPRGACRGPDASLSVQSSSNSMAGGY